MKFLQRSLAMLLVIAMCSGMMLTTAFAEELGEGTTKPTCTGVEGCPVPGTGVHLDTCPRNPNYKPAESVEPEATEEPVEPEETAEPDGSEHEHSYTAVAVITPATCTEDGLQGYVCSVCGEPEYVDGILSGGKILATGHDFVDGVCTKCDAPDPDASVEPEQPECTKHEFGSEWVADGDFHYHVCEVCGVSQGTSKASHAPGEAVREDVTDSSYDEVVYCTVCSAELSRETVNITTDGEGPAEPEEPKCTSTRHVKLILVVGTYATCTEDGVKDHYECMVCGKQFLGTKECTEEDLVIPATGHHYVDGVCSDCGAAEPVSECRHISPTHHDAVPATCTEDGMKAYWVCNDCGKMFVGTNNTEVTEEDLIVPATGHSYSDQYESQGTWHAQVCGVCGEAGEHAAHTGVWVVVKEATSEAEGLKVCKCETCGYVLKEEVIPAAGSGSDPEGPVDPDEPTVPDPTDPDLADTPDHVHTDGVEHSTGMETVVQAPTCAEAGYKVFWCFTCDGYYKEIIPATGDHAWGDEWTADSDGHVHTCEVCGASQATSKAPHTPGEAVREIEDGVAYDVVRCTDCGAEISRTTIIDDPDIPTSGGPSSPSDGSYDDEDATDDGLVEIDDDEVPLSGLMTRAEFVNYLYVRKGSPSAPWPSFTDVPADHLYAMAIGWAEINGIARGISETEFAPDALVTVEQARLFLSRYAELEGRAMPELAALPYKDPDEVLVEADGALDEFFGGEDL